MKSYECDGAPHGPGEDLGGFAPSGNPTNLNHQGRASVDDGYPKDPLQPSPKDALAEFGGLPDATKSGSIITSGAADNIERAGEPDPSNIKV